MNIEEKLDRIPDIIKQENFRTNTGLGNEVGYYILDYDEKNELIVRSYIDKLVENNCKSTSEYNIIKFDLYEIMINYLVERNFLEECFNMEKEDGFAYMSEAITELLRMDDEFNYFTEYIDENTPENSIIFLTGVGKVYPIIRSHSILNKLHQFINKVPVVLLFPGQWDGQKLKLFSKIDDGNYYRAFKLIS